MGNTWEPGRERFWEAKETLEYMDSRSFAVVDERLTMLSVTMGARTDRLFADNAFCGGVGEDIVDREHKALRSIASGLD
jgi:hypothetical protein